MTYKPWRQEDYRIREALRSANSIEQLFLAYRENQLYISTNQPELAKFALRVFWVKFCAVPNFVFLVRAKDVLFGLPENDMVFRTIRNIFLDQIKINYNFNSVC